MMSCPENPYLVKNLAAVFLRINACQSTCIYLDIPKSIFTTHKAPKSSSFSGETAKNDVSNFSISASSMLLPGVNNHISGIIPKPELRGFWGDSLTKPPFKVTSAEVVTICRPHIRTMVRCPISNPPCTGCG